MVYYYFVIGCFYFVLKSDQNVQASDSLGCQTVIAGIKMNSEWKVFNSQKVISWQRKSDGSTAVKSCGFNVSPPSVRLVLKLELGSRNTIALIHLLTPWISFKQW